MFAVIKSGGIFMIPIVVCAVSATFIIIERLLFFKAMKKSNAALMPEIESKLAAGNFDGAAAYCKAAGTPLAFVFEKAIACRGMKEDNLKEAAANEIARQIPILEHLLTPLGTIANISTLLGLLGTVTGNIRAFGVLGAGSTMGNPALLAGSISEALVTTAAGLLISIPSVIFHNYFVSQADRFISQIESASSDLILRLKK
ncbi:MAG: MotA/TolQ/ExbB proton channel family protein [Bacteroides sp.]|nr:MotA/TolQ/ExbB proton channel family protein [Prevotella sp.]MCM1408538.1 MotA/TolQ/ExbB proton channel family protein [Treponema brennaborense]MCM1470748.1 MotA/TolQ/ExbB proton channel family protein [Bacteroides sp.]